MAPRKAAPKALIASKKDAPATRADNDGIQGDNREIHLGVDYGSVNVSAAWYIYTPGIAIEETTVRNICFDDIDEVAPNVLAVRHTTTGRRLVWGFEQMAMIDSGEVREEDGIEFMKLGLYENISEEMAERWNDIKSQTEAYDLDELLSEHMAAIVRDCREQINKSKVQLNVGKAVLERLPIVIRFSVPQMWSIDAKERMQNAAKRAGLGVVALASEPQAVLANLIHNIDEDGKSLGCDLSKGDCTLVIDLGGGTGDFVSNELKDELSAKSRLEAVFASSGSLCGSQRVNEYILTHIVETGAEVTKAGGLDAVLAQHNLSRTLWRKRTLAQIENAKLKNGKKKIHCGIVEGGTGAPRFYFDLKDSDIERAIDQVLVDINIEIAKHVAHKKPKVIIVAGGFSRSPYLMKKLRERWTQGQGIDVVKDHDKADSALLAVSRGSLFRYDNISAQNLPSRYGYAILQDMEYDRKKHPDAETILQVWNEFTQTYWPEIGPNPNIVVTSERDEYTPIVRDRLKMVMREGATAAGDGPIEKTFDQDYIIFEEDPKLSATFVYIERDGAKDGDPSRCADNQDEFLPGIFEWKTIMLDFEEFGDFAACFEKAGFEITLSDHGLARYHMRATLKFTYLGGDNLRICWVVRSPNTNRLFWAKTWTVWDGKFSEFIEEDTEMTDA